MACKGAYIGLCNVLSVLGGEGKLDCVLAKRNLPWQQQPVPSADRVLTTVRSATLVTQARLLDRVFWSTLEAVLSLALAAALPMSTSAFSPWQSSSMRAAKYMQADPMDNLAAISLMVSTEAT